MPRAFGLLPPLWPRPRPPRRRAAAPPLLQQRAISGAAAGIPRVRTARARHSARDARFLPPAVPYSRPPPPAPPAALGAVHRAFSLCSISRVRARLPAPPRSMPATTCTSIPSPAAPSAACRTRALPHVWWVVHHLPLYRVGFFARTPLIARFSRVSFVPVYFPPPPRSRLHLAFVLVHLPGRSRAYNVFWNLMEPILPFLPFYLPATTYRASHHIYFSCPGDFCLALLQTTSSRLAACSTNGAARRRGGHLHTFVPFLRPPRTALQRSYPPMCSHVAVPILIHSHILMEGNTHSFKRHKHEHMVSMNDKGIRALSYLKRFA